MSEEMIRISLRGSRDLVQATRNMLWSKGVSVEASPDQGESLVIPNDPFSLNAALGVFEELGDAAAGTVEVPKSGRFSLNEGGRRALRQLVSVTYQSMQGAYSTSPQKPPTQSMKEEDAYSTSPQKPPTFSELYREEVRQILKEIPRAMRSWQGGGLMVRSAHVGFTPNFGFVFGILLLVVISILGIFRIVSGDAVAFLAGSMIGYLFSISHRQPSPRERSGFNDIFSPPPLPQPQGSETNS